MLRDPWILESTIHGSRLTVHNSSMVYDIIIIGGGCAGLAAAMYASRYEMTVLVFAKLPGGLITTTHIVENYPGVPTWTGMEMGDKFLEHAKKFGAKILVHDVKEVRRDDSKGLFIAKTAKVEFEGKTLVLATGSEHRHLDVPGEKEYANRGVSYCAVCDAAFYKQKVVAVIGGSDSAAKEALLLSEYASKVYIVYRGSEIRPEPINKVSVEANPKIEIIYNTNVAEFVGDGEKLQKLRFKEGGDLAVDGAFIAVGQLPNNELAKQLGVVLSEKGEILINAESRTNIPYVYAAGDVTQVPFRQAIISAAQGAYAATSAYDDLQKLKVKN